MNIFTKTEFWQGVIATICVLGCFICHALGRNSFVDIVLTAVLVSYLGIDIGFFRRKRK